MRNHCSSAMFLSLIAAAAACSSAGGGEGGGGGTPIDKAELDLSFTFTTAPGEETHWCQYVRLPKGMDGSNPGQGVSVTGYTWDWTNMHHWSLYRTTPDLPATVAMDQPFDCFAPGALKYASIASLVLAGTAEGEQRFPDGTGFTFTPGEVVIFQAHSLNTSTSPVDAKLDVKLTMADPTLVPNPLGLIQFYDPYISVPAGAKAKAQMRCRIPNDMTVLYGTTHQHARGVGVDVFLDPAMGARATSPFLESPDWEHPSVIETPLELEAGSYLRTVCSYHGDDHDVFQGQTKEDDEMCMFIGYYYPVIPAPNGGLFENCVQDSIEGGVGDEYGVGTKSCSDSLACIQTCSPKEAPNPVDGRIDVGPCWQQCLVDSCPSATGPLNDLGACVQAHCADACAEASTCANCVLTNCGLEYSACQGATCADL